MLSITWSPCRPYHPAGVESPPKPAFGDPCCLHPFSAGSASGTSEFSRPPVGSLSLRPGDARTNPKLAWSMGLRPSVSLQSAIQATGSLALTLAGLPPAEDTSLTWTHTEILYSYAPAKLTISDENQNLCGMLWTAHVSQYQVPSKKVSTYRSSYVPTAAWSAIIDLKIMLIRHNIAISNKKQTFPLLTPLERLIEGPPSFSMSAISVQN